MIIVYFLPVITVYDTEQVVGLEFIHDAILESTVEPDIRRLIMDTTDAEHDGLLAAGAVSEAASQKDIERWLTEVTITPPDPDIEALLAIIANPPTSITMPEIWAAIRILSKLHGITY